VIAVPPIGRQELGAPRLSGSDDEGDDDEGDDHQRAGDDQHIVEEDLCCGFWRHSLKLHNLSRASMPIPVITEIGSSGRVV
jgi:hypothetical protein